MTTIASILGVHYDEWRCAAVLDMFRVAMYQSKNQNRTFLHFLMVSVGIFIAGATILWTASNFSRNIEQKLGAHSELVGGFAVFVGSLAMLVHSERTKNEAKSKAASAG